MHEACRGREPHRVVAIAQQAEGDVGRKPVVVFEVLVRAGRIEARQARALGRDPETAALVEHGVHHFILLEAFLLAVRAPLAVAQHAHAAARRADDERAIGRDTDRPHAVVAQIRRVAPVDEVEFEAVVADQPFPGAEPQVAVGRLRDRVDLVVRQAFARGPGFAEIGVDGLAGRERGRRHQQQRNQCKEPAHPTPSAGPTRGPCASDSRPTLQSNRARRTGPCVRPACARRRGPTAPSGARVP